MFKSLELLVPYPNDLYRNNIVSKKMCVTFLSRANFKIRQTDEQTADPTFVTCLLCLQFPPEDSLSGSRYEAAT